MQTWLKKLNHHLNVKNRGKKIILVPQFQLQVHKLLFAGIDPEFVVGEKHPREAAETLQGQCTFIGPTAPIEPGTQTEFYFFLFYCFSQKQH